jgi:hypothetical protein
MVAVDKSSQLLRLLHLASPALPIGGFHFSQGLEFAVEHGWVKDEASALEWIGGILESSLSTLDLPVLHRLHGAWNQNDYLAVRRWNAFLLASRETQEFRAEDRHLGAALLRVLAEFQLIPEIFAGRMLPPPGVSHAAAFTLACARWGIDARGGGRASARQPPQSSSARPRHSGRPSAATAATAKATANTMNRPVSPVVDRSRGTSSGATTEAIRPKAAALPAPVARRSVG